MDIVVYIGVPLKGLMRYEEDRCFQETKTTRYCFCHPVLYFVGDRCGLRYTKEAILNTFSSRMKAKMAATNHLIERLLVREKALSQGMAKAVEENVAY